MKKIIIKQLLFYLILIFIAPLGIAAEFKIKPSKSNIVAIACCHAFIQEVEILFKEFFAIADYDLRNKKIISFKATVEADSLDSKNSKRDKHLRGTEFFAVNNFPTITFESTSIKTETDKLFITGFLTMKGISKEVNLQAKIISSENNNFEISANGEINSKDFGVGTSKQKDIVKLKINSFFERN